MGTTTLTEIEEVAAQSVGRGALFLDAIDSDWFATIDVDNIEMGNSDWCVLGQRENQEHDGSYGYWSAIERLNLQLSQLHHMGFEAYGDIEDADNTITEQYRALDAAWRVEILRRRAGAS